MYILFLRSVIFFSFFSMTFNVIPVIVLGDFCDNLCCYLLLTKIKTVVLLVYFIILSVFGAYWSCS